MEISIYRYYNPTPGRAGKSSNFQIELRFLLTIIIALVIGSTHAQNAATVKEYNKVFKTYPFSDPDPIPRMGNIYPYFRFDGYTDKGVDKSWKVVELENDYISVMILPEIGGKIWAATEKSTGKPFLYYNHVVKFRDIAMRGPWTSGGIEANYGIIGHTPNCSTPVDYTIRKDLFDGSVSCFIGTLDLLTQTYWTIEIKLESDKAYFTTRSFWSNTTPIEQPYYTWMNAGIKAAGNLEFVYPGTHYLGHDGSNKPWPIQEGSGRNISFYEQNNFGAYKSYHVFGKYTNFFGGFWHNENFGMGRYAPHEDKAGKKIWIWGLSQQGMIWENLLSDTDGQYVEVQSGRLFNQTDHTSSSTPFKHRGFAPYSTDGWMEYWFPVKGTKGFVTASPTAAMNVRVRSGSVRVDISPLESRKEKLVIKQGEKVLLDNTVELKTLQLLSDSVAMSSTEPVTVFLGDQLTYTNDPADGVLSRPVESPKDFDWNSVQGLHLEGKEFIRERQYTKAAEKLESCLAKDLNYLPALTDLAMVRYRNMEYTKAMALLTRALSIDTYDPAANFYYGLTALALGRRTDARDGFDIAAMDPGYRGAAYTELSRMELRDKHFEKSMEYAQLGLRENELNVEAMQLLSVATRLRPRAIGEPQDAGRDSLWLSRLKFINPLNHFAWFESFLLRGTPAAQKAFTSGIRNELAVETYLELGAWYYRAGMLKEAKQVLEMAPANAEVLFWLAFLDQKLGLPHDKSLAKAVDATAAGVFPFRAESAEIFAWATGVTGSWKTKYFLGLIYWDKNKTDNARELFAACGNSVDFAPFYAARAELIPQSSLVDLQKAAELDPRQWRYGKLLIQHFIKEKKYAEALKVAQTYDKRLPNDFRLRLLLAKANLLNGNYAACNEVLSKTQVLPYEGSTEGHALYREAWLMQAIAKLKSKKYSEALTMISKARLYPVNLGVGKPYDENIDSRVEYFLEGLCQTGMKQQNKALASWAAVTKQAHADGLTNLVTAWSIRKQNKETEGKSFLYNWANRSPSPLTKWCIDVYDGKVVAWDLGSEPEGLRLVEEIIVLMK